MELSEIRELCGKIRENINRVIVGKEDVIDHLLIAMVASGHILLEDVPGTGKTMMGEVVGKVSIRKVLEAVGVGHIQEVNPLDLDAAAEAVRTAADQPGVSAILFQSPCIAVVRPKAPLTVDREACTGCRRCVRELGCPAIVSDGRGVRIEPSLCTGCTLCAQVCGFGAIKEGQV